MAEVSLSRKGEQIISGVPESAILLRFKDIFLKMVTLERVYVINDAIFVIYPNSFDDNKPKPY